MMPPETAPLDVDRIEAARTGARLGRRVVLFKSTASTNDIAWQYAGRAAHDGLCVLAESQSRGRGRRGRTWHSEPGQSVLMSLLLLHAPLDADALTLTVAVAAAEAIGAVCNLPARIKWPNDILVNGKKLAGILVEKKIADGRARYVVGLGVNCNQPPGAFDPIAVRLPATSLLMETGQAVDRNALTCELLAAMETWLAVPNPADVVHRWQQLSALLGRHITVEADNRTYSGFCRGIDPAEGLIVQLDAGPVKIFPAGQTTVQSIEAQNPESEIRNKDD